MMNIFPAFISKNENYIDDHQLTFFEVTTAMAFQYFKDMKTRLLCD